MAGHHGPSFADATRVAEAFAALSSEAQKVVGQLARLPLNLAEAKVRAEVREFLLVCDDAGLDPVEVERTRQVLAAYEGVLGGEATESVRRVA